MSVTTDMKELRTALQEAKSVLQDGVANGLKIEGNNMQIDQKSWDLLQAKSAEVKKISEVMAMVEMGMDGGTIDQMLKSMESPVGGSAALSAAAANAGGFGNLYAQRKSLGAMFVGSDEFKAFQKQGGSTMNAPFTVDGIKDVPRSGMEMKDVITSGVDPLSTLGFGRVQFDPMVPRGQRANRVRDLFNVASTSANLIDYFQVIGFAENNGDGNAGTVRERSAADETSAPTGGSTDVFTKKPKSNLTFRSAQAPVRTIAHWEAAHRNVLDDEPQLQSTINNELLYGLALEEDDQILNGDGQGENLKGILRHNDIQVYDSATQHPGDLRSDALRRASTLSTLANYPGTGFVLHPFDWEAIELQKATGGGDGQYMLVTNFAVGMQTQVWRQPVVETPVIAEGTFLTGAFGLGAQLYDRMQATVRIAEQHEDFFVRNAVAILCEERIALAVKRPESFVRGQFES